MSILVTGAGGFIGLNAVEQLLAQGRTVTALGLAPLHALAMERFAALPGTLRVEVADVRDAPALRRIFAEHGITRVLHTAAITAGPAAAGAVADRVIDVNVAGTHALLHAAREAGAARFVLTSSTAVYGESPFEPAPLTEDTPATPATLYGITKLAAERLAAQYRNAYGLDVVRTRLTAIYGPWEHDTGVRDTLSPPFQIARAAVRGEPVTVADGGRRDWTSAVEIARALVTLLQAPAPRHDLYNLGCGAIWHPELLCQALAAHFPRWQWQRAPAGQAPSVDYNDALDRVRVSPPAPARFEAEFGPVFRPAEAGVKDYAAWVADAGRRLAG